MLYYLGKSDKSEMFSTPGDVKIYVYGRKISLFEHLEKKMRKLRIVNFVTICLQFKRNKKINTLIVRYKIIYHKIIYTKFLS